jgi:hypothetical protein
MVFEQENNADECNLQVVDSDTSVTPFTEDYVADVKESCSTTEYFCHARRRSKEVNLQNTQYRINAKHHFQYYFHGFQLKNVAAQYANPI